MHAVRPAHLRSTRRLVVVASLLLLQLCLVYVPDGGHGFLRDDFRWIAQYRLRSLSDLVTLFQQDNGFYRPLVGLSFAVNTAAFGLAPKAFALANLGMLIGAATALFAFARSLQMPWGAGLVAAALWSFNPHGVPMSILWISGRTALLLTLFAVLAARACAKRQSFRAGIWCLAALLSKEEAVLLPLILFLLAGFISLEAGQWNFKRSLRLAVFAFLALIPYFALRAHTRAFLPPTAPDYYRLSVDPSLLIRNVLEYADRTATFSSSAVLLAWMVVRRRPQVGSRETCWIRIGIAWLIGAFGLTVLLPIRSSLYVCFPSVGVALIAAAILWCLWRVASEQQRRVLLLGTLIPSLLFPVYRSRAARWVRPAELSHRVLTELASGRKETGSVVVLRDREGKRANLAGAFGTLVEDGVRLYTSEPFARAWIDPPVPGWQQAGLKPPERGERVETFVFRGGHLHVQRE